jgi:hypothetical protein
VGNWDNVTEGKGVDDSVVLGINGLVLGVTTEDKDCRARLPNLTGSLGIVGLLGNSFIGKLGLGGLETGLGLGLDTNTGLLGSSLLGLCGLTLGGKGL